ncbi:MAG: ABC transporter permease [Lachnospiraceae bacterium]|nr:ABC transporter permease [Lachnospiraceae bacterium]
MIENIILSMRGIWSHKLRSILTMLGVIIGIASIIAIVSIVQGTNRKLEKSLIGSGNNVVSVSVLQDNWEYDFSSGVPSGIPVVNDASIANIKQMEGVVDAGKFHFRQGWNQVFYKDVGLSYGKICGINAGYLDMVEYQISAGRDFSEEEYTTGKKVAIIDESARDIMFNGENPVGEAIEINKEPFVVVGVAKNLNKQEEEYESINDYYMNSYSNGQGQVFIPDGTWPIVYQFDEPESVAIKVENVKQMQPAAKMASEELNMYLTSGEYSYGSSSGEGGEELKMLTNAIQLMLVGIASLSLLVGGIGVMNIMLVSVTERTSEIGLKKALGAKRRVIMAQFLTESAVLTSVGGLLGIILGIGLAKLISTLAGLEFAVSIPWIFISVGFSMGIGILFGAMPASKASKLNPIEALRRD